MINSNLFPCLWFNGKGKEAANFYSDLFDGKVTTDTPMVQNIELFGQKIMLQDAGPQFEKNPSISFMVNCFAEEEIEKYWHQLSENGNVLMALDSYPWSKKYGWIQDRYGLSWQLMLSEKKDFEQKIIPTFMFVNENCGKAQIALDFYTQIFPNSKVEYIMKYGEGHPAKENPNYIAHADFTLDHYNFSLMESSAHHHFNFSEGISIVIMTDNQEQTDYLWNSLIANGGNESMCGWLKDQFGVSWQIVPKRLLELGIFAENKEKGKKVFEAMMGMRKIIIKELEEAYDS